MSKLLTDLMEAERKRRRLAIGRSAGDATTGADERVVAGQPAAAALSCAVAEADSSELAAAAAALPRVAAEHEAPAETASSQLGPERTGWRLFAATALALMTGIGTGLWLGKSPAVPVRPWSEDPGVLRLRLDDKLLNPPLQTNRASPRDRSH